MKEWTKKESREVSRGKIYSYLQETYQSNETSTQGVFDILKFNDWVNIFALNSDGEVILVKQFRAGNQKLTLEIPGGAIDFGESDPLLAAQRELQEETGYTSKKWTLLGKVDPNPAFMRNNCYSFLAEDCVKSADQNLDHLEEIEVESVALSEFNQMVETGEIAHSLVLSTYLLYRMKKEKSI